MFAKAGILPALSFWVAPMRYGLRFLILLLIALPLPFARVQADGNTPWRGEQTVHVRYYGNEKWKPFYQNVVPEMNRLTEHMPYAPTWVFVDEDQTTCTRMMEIIRSGVTICTFTEANGGEWWEKFKPAGCSICAAGPGPRRVYDRDDGWWGKILVEATDYVVLGTTCGLGPCSNAYNLGQGIAFHEMGHAWLGLGHVAGSTTTGHRPWGPTDFARAEKWFGQSTRSFCQIYPNSNDCDAQGSEGNPGAPGESDWD